MSFLNNLFRKKSASPATLNDKLQRAQLDTQSQQLIMQLAEEIAHPLVAGHNFMTLFMSVPEVFFPIDFIASRIAKATFEVKRYKDDSVVWTRNKMLTNLSHPNCVQTWSELVYSHFVYKLATGNAYLRAAMAEAFRTGRKYKMCDHYWSLPADEVSVKPVRNNNLPIFGICEKGELVDRYELAVCGQKMVVPEWEVFHDRDGKAEFSSGYWMKSKSRLLSVMKPISNLIAVYEARNVIYVKRGGIGFLVNVKQDVTGNVALTEKEKTELREEMNKNYGVGAGQSPIGYTDVPLQFVRTNLSIAELQPFEETLEDAVKIAGAYGIPADLVPRKDKSTYANQITAEKSAYCSVVIPMANQFCNDLTHFFGLDQDGYYLAADFSDVDCLQQGMKEKEEVKKLTNERCLMQFNCGLITLNDWRAQIGESQIEEDVNPIFSKLKFDMTADELARVKEIMGGSPATESQGTVSQSINNKPQSEDEEQQSGNQEEPGVSDQGE